MTRIFVGTMKSGEEEFDECRRAILAQKNVEVVHFIIDSLPEYEAHNALWNAWNDVKKRFDLFIKVDADTIVEDPEMFSKIAEEFKKNPRLTGMQIPLHDYFTDAPINGLNCFSPAVIFKPAKDRLHADHADSGHDIVYRNEQVAHLSPAGKHCSFPNDKQAFHFGLHRMKKKQLDTIIKVYRAWKTSGGNARLIALYGAYTAAITKVDHDYTASSFTQIFSRLMNAGIFEEKNLKDLEAFMKSIGA